MKNLILFCVLSASLAVSGQEFVRLKDKSLHTGTITEITNDSVILYDDGNYLRFSRDNIYKAGSNNSFKSFLINNEIHEDHNVNLMDYTNFKMDRYRKENNVGKILQLAGLGASAYYIFKDDDIFYLYLGGGLSVLGFLVEWHSNHWLRNLTLNFERGIGVGYKFPINY